MEEVDQRPMGRLQKQTSQDRYANYWKRLICYSLRVARDEQEQSRSRVEDEESQDENGGESEEDGGESEEDGGESEEDGGESEEDGGESEEDGDESEEDGDESEEDGGESEEDREGPSSEEDGAPTKRIVCRDKMKDARGLFPWRDGQKEQATRLIEWVETGTGRVTSAVLDFRRSFIFHKV